jgi:hypothetical protein
LTDQTTGQSTVRPETAAPTVLADTGHLATTAHFTSMTRHSTQAQDGALQPLLERLPPARSGWRQLVIVMGQLGDFDSMEYAQALVPRLAELEAARIDLRAFAIGDQGSAERFCGFTGFPQQCLEVDPHPGLHKDLGLYPGLKAPGGPWPGFLLMCAGIGSPGTLQEVLRGYTGDRSAPQIFADDEEVKAWPLPAFSAAMFARAGGRGFQRPFELATKRLRNMGEVLGHWRTYVPTDDHISQRGGTFLIDEDGFLLYEWRDTHLLGFAADMAMPLAFLEPYLSIDPG